MDGFQPFCKHFEPYDRFLGHRCVNAGSLTWGSQGLHLFAGPSYPGVRLNSAISAITSDEGKLVHVQMPNSTVRELLSNGTAETSYFARALDVEGQTAIPGTKLGSVILNTTLGGQEIHLFYQPNASTVTDYVRTLDGETWSAYTVPIGP